MISRLAMSAISIVKLISVPEETGLSPALSETRKTGFVALRPIYGLIRVCLNIVLFEPCCIQNGYTESNMDKTA